MKLQKTVSTLATLSILSFAVACNSGGGNDRYAEGFAAGKAEGYQEGYDAGDTAGYNRAKAYFETADYTKGFNDGKQQGIATGYTQGYNVGKADGYTQGYNAGEDDGWELGFDAGFEAGEEVGWEAGFDAGFEAGEDYGWDIGFNDGWDAADEACGYCLSVGKTPKLKGYADVLSAFHNDLIDYSKIQAPVQTKRGLVANGQLLLSEVSMTNKDTLKKVAVTEQYLVIEMAKQVKGKFGLSAERSLQVAKAANHFRKQASSRSLTSEDTNAYASELIGVSFDKLSKAYSNSAKGDISDLSSILEKAAEKNGTTPEHMGEIMAKMFL